MDRIRDRRPVESISDRPPTHSRRAASVKTKICGLCRPADAACAASAGAHHLGVVLSPGSARTQSLERAAAIFAEGADSRRVGVMVDPTRDQVALAVESLALDVVQLHGSESPEEAEAARTLGCEVWKAIRPRSPGEVVKGGKRYAGAVDTLLLDGYSSRGPGGQGARFDWSGVAAVRDRLPADLRLVIAGGLEPTNVADAIELLRPDVVDVSSGVEDQPGRKSTELMHAFLAAAARGKSP